MYTTNTSKRIRSSDKTVSRDTVVIKWSDIGKYLVKSLRNWCRRKETDESRQVEFINEFLFELLYGVEKSKYLVVAYTIVSSLSSWCCKHFRDTTNILE